MKKELSKQIDRIMLECIAGVLNINPEDMNAKIIANGFSVGDVYRVKHQLNLDNKRLCEIFKI